MRIVQSRFRAPLLWMAATVVIVAGAMATHLPYLFASDCLDSDAAVVALMGRHFAHGEITPFFWGQRYMGALEAWVLMPVSWASWLGGRNALYTACLVALCLTAVQAVFVARIAARAGGSVFVAVLLVTTSSAITAFAQTTLYGGRLAATALVLAALDTIQARPTTRRVVLSGLLTGVALFGDHLMIVWAIPIALAAHRNRNIVPFLAAAVPWVVFERLCFTFATGPRPGIADPWEWPRNIKLLVLDGLPMAFGADWAAAKQSDFTPPVPSVPCVALSLATASLALCALVWVTRSWRTKLVVDLALVPLATAGMFVLAAQDTESTRYLPPAWPALAILASLAATSRPALGLVGAVITAANMALSVAKDTFHPHGATAGEACRAELSATASVLGDAGVRGAWADYWDVYRLGLFMNEELPFAPFRGVDRRREWTSLVRQASPVAYLLTDARAPKELREALDRVATARRLGRYDLYVLPQSLPAP
jgi:hypothetical protein